MVESMMSSVLWNPSATRLSTNDRISSTDSAIASPPERWINPLHPCHFRIMIILPNVRDKPGRDVAVSPSSRGADFKSDLQTPRNSRWRQYREAATLFSLRQSATPPLRHSWQALQAPRNSNADTTEV